MKSDAILFVFRYTFGGRLLWKNKPCIFFKRKIYIFRKINTFYQGRIKIWLEISVKCRGKTFQKMSINPVSVCQCTIGWHQCSFYSTKIYSGLPRYFIFRLLNPSSTTLDGMLCLSPSLSQQDGATSCWLGHAISRSQRISHLPSSSCFSMPPVIC